MTKNNPIKLFVETSLSLLFIILLFLVFPLKGNAESTGIGFSVQPIFSRNQKASSYYDLKIKPSQNYLLKAKVNNDNNHSINVHASVNTALTSSNADIDYGQNCAKKFDTSMQYPLSKLTDNKDQTLLVPAHKSVISQFRIKAPKQAFNGIILGSLSFANTPFVNHNRQKNKVNINNSYSYDFPVLLDAGHNVNPNLKLLNAGGKLINGTDNFYGHFQNDQPNFMTSVKMLGEIYSQHGYDHHAKPLYLQANNNASIAPNTNFNYLIDTNGQGFKAGQYVFVGTAKWGKHHFRFVKHFRLHFKQAYEDNHKATGVHNNDNWILWLLLILLLIILIITFVVLYIRNRRKNKRFRMYYLKHHK